MSEMRAVISIAARMTSKRLPGKVLRPVAGVPILELIVRRLSTVGPQVVIATTDSPQDGPIRDLGYRLGVHVHCGSPDDLMARHWEVMRLADADLLLLAGADDPLLDPAIFRRVLERLHWRDVEYVKTAEWPLGMNAWGWTRGAMEAGYREATAKDEREHVAPFWERRPRRFRQDVIRRPRGNLYDQYRVTVDNPSDLALADLIVRELGTGAGWGAEDVIDLLDAHPEWAAINADGLHGTKARDAIYSIDPVDDDGPEVDDLAKVRAHVAVERRAALAAIPERGAFAEGQAAALLSLDQWLGAQ